MTTPHTFGFRPFSGLWTTTRFREAEQWLGRPIGTTVLMVSRNGADTMLANVRALMNPKAKNGIPSDISQRLRVVMTVPLAFGRGITAKTPAGQAEIRRLLLGTAGGQWDRQYAAAAQAMVDGGHGDDIIRLGHEQTGPWYPWSAVGNPDAYKAAYRQTGPWDPWSADGNADAYKAAFRHVHDVMARVAPQLRWEYNSAVAGFAEWAEAAYPGDPYVDVAGLDIYNKASGKNPPPFGVTWQRKLQPALQAHLHFARSHGKPVSYAEWANGSQDTPQFIDAMADWFGRLPAHGPGALEYHSYFDVAQRAYNLDLYPESKTAFRRRFGK